MSAPATLACALVACCLGVPVIAAATQVDAAHRATAAADAASLAAADAAAGYAAEASAQPCEIAARTVEAVGGMMTRCDLRTDHVDARVSVSISGPFGAAVASSRAGVPPVSALPGGPAGLNGWAWPSAAPGVSQGFHDGFAIDLHASEGDPLYAAYAGTVVVAGSDGGGIPETCAVHPEWWRGPNHTVVIRHDFLGQVLFSSHNHIAPGSAAALGIRVGAEVRAGQVVALAGMSGCTSGPHTHFTLASAATNSFPDINPYLYIAAPTPAGGAP